MEFTLLLILAGVMAGIIAGLLGVGGGIVIVPVLAFLFQSQDIDISVLMHTAIGTSLATIIITAISSTRAHHKHGAVNWKVFRQLTPGIIIGALLGTAAAKVIGGDNLRMLFIAFMFYVALQFAIGFRPGPHRKLPGAAGLFVSGAVIGTVSSMAGIGGGTLSVPFMTWCNVTVRSAVATSSALGIPIAVAGTAGFIVTGWNVPSRPEWSLGYINLPAFFAIIVSSIAFAPVGARLAHRIPEQTLKRLFAVFLLIMAIRMLLTG